MGRMDTIYANKAKLCGGDYEYDFFIVIFLGENEKERLCRCITFFVSWFAVWQAGRRTQTKDSHTGNLTESGNFIAGNY